MDNETDDANVTRLARMWPAVSARLVRAVRRFGPDPDDLVQDVAERALRRPPGCLTEDDLFRWALAVARTVAIDRSRKHLWPLAAVEAPERLPVHDDVADVVEARQRWQRVVAALASAPPAERQAAARLLTPPDHDRSPQEQARDRARVLRLRSRLSRALDGLAVVVVRMRHRITGARTDAGALIAAAAVSVLLAAGGGAPPAAGTDVAMRPPAPSPAPALPTATGAPAMPGPASPDAVPQAPARRDTRPADDRPTAPPGGGRVVLHHVPGPGGQPLAEVGFDRNTPGRPLLCLTPGGPLAAVGTACVYSRALVTVAQPGTPAGP